MVAPDDAGDLGIGQPGQPQLEQAALLLRELGEEIVHRLVGFPAQRVLFRGRRGVAEPGGGLQRAIRVTASVPVMIGDDVMGDREEPGAERERIVIASVAWEGSERIGEDEAGGILRIGPIAEPVIAIAIDGVEIALVERGERVRVALGAGDEHGFDVGLGRGNGGDGGRMQRTRHAGAPVLKAVCTGE